MNNHSKSYSILDSTDTRWPDFVVGFKECLKMNHIPEFYLIILNKPNYGKPCYEVGANAHN